MQPIPPAPTAARAAATTPAPACRPRGRAARLRLRFAPLAFVALVTGCATTLERPASGIAVPADWDEARTATTTRATSTTSAGNTSSDDAVTGARWWQAFGSAPLDRLVEQALAANNDLAIARERVVQAELAVRQSGAVLFPALSADLATQARAASNAAGRSDSSRAGLVLAYELDVWGSERTALLGSEARLTASRHDLAAARLSLAGGVVDAYATVLALQARIVVARSNAAIAERLLGIVESRFRNGSASALDVSRQRSATLSARDAIDPLELSLRQTVRALAILTGAVPQGFAVEAAALQSLALPAARDALPAALLAQRPDIAAAEARLGAAQADVAVARAALFPLRFSIDLDAALASERFAFAALGGPAAAASFSVSLLQAVFDGGQREAQVGISESQQRALLADYRGTVLGALGEVDDALGELARAARNETTRQSLRDEAARALRLAEVRYREGAEDLSTLLDTQRSLFTAEDALIQARLARISAAVALIKASGGGDDESHVASADTR